MAHISKPMATIDMTKSKSMRSEEMLSEQFSAVSAVRRKVRGSDWNTWETAELRGLFGVPDRFVVLWRQTPSGRRNIRTVAFEIKRDKWKRALIQAYRYLAFADMSIVVLDAEFVHRALPHLNEFKKSNVGLISLTSEGALCWHHVPRFQKPYLSSARLFLRNAISAHLFSTPKRLHGPSIKWK